MLSHNQNHKYIEFKMSSCSQDFNKKKFLKHYVTKIVESSLSMVINHSL